MEFGLDINTRTRVKPSRKQQAICQCCEEELIAKCGKIRVHHWAHKKSHCDSWWEPETEWHRNWKSKFPAEWRESIKYDALCNEKHIADVYNPYKDLVIEFQNSPISLEELNSREIFYQKMIWVINAQTYIIETSPLKPYHNLVKELLKTILSRQINDTIKIPNEVVTILNIKRDEILQTIKIGSYKQQIKELEDLFQSEFNNIIEKFLNNEIINLVGVKPSIVLSDLLNPFVYNIKDKFYKYSIKNEQLDKENCYLSYIWKRKKKVWDFASKPIFLDTGEDLLWIHDNSILKKIPYSKFISKYSLDF